MFNVKSLREKIKDLTKEKNIYTIKEIIDHFGTDSHWAVLFIINLPLAIPTPPIAMGFSTLPSGFISLILMSQILIGHKTVQIPDFLNNREIDVSILKSDSYKKIDEQLEWIESFLKKRNTHIFTPIFEKMLVLILLPNVIFMLLPIVLTNAFPAMTIVITSFIFLFKDGKSIFFAIFFSLFVTFVVTLMLLGFGKLLLNFKNYFFFLKKKRSKNKLR